MWTFNSEKAYNYAQQTMPIKGNTLLSQGAITIFGLGARPS